MATIVKELKIRLTPADVARAMQAFGAAERTELRDLLAAGGDPLVEEIPEFWKLIDDEDVPPQPDYQIPATYEEALPPGEPIPEFWLLIEDEEPPEPPPPTPEGDKIALEAVEWIRGRLPITDPELAEWLATRYTTW